MQSSGWLKPGELIVYVMREEMEGGLYLFW